MYYKITVVKRKRTCGYCRKDVLKGKAIIEEIDWQNERGFPTKANFCRDCFGKIICPALIECAEAILKGAKKAQEKLDSTPSGDKAGHTRGMLTCPLCGEEYRKGTHIC